MNQRTKETFRLPTEEEWEYAARSGGKAQRFAGGDDLAKLSWYRRNSRGKTHPVGTRQPNGLGLYDMSGNVWEWCKDVFVADRYARKLNLVKPGVELKEEGRVCRGGCYLNTWPNIRCSNRNHYPESYKFLNLGFRLVREAGPGASAN